MVPAGKHVHGPLPVMAPTRSGRRCRECWDCSSRHLLSIPAGHHRHTAWPMRVAACWGLIPCHNGAGHRKQSVVGQEASAWRRWHACRSSMRTVRQLPSVVASLFSFWQTLVLVQQSLALAQPEEAGAMHCKGWSTIQRGVSGGPCMLSSSLHAAQQSHSFFDCPTARAALLWGAPSCSCQGHLTERHAGTRGCCCSSCSWSGRCCPVVNSCKKRVHGAEMVSASQ